MNDWDRIVRELGPMVFGTAWRILGHAADTEDVVQEVFLEAHKLQQTQPVRHWPAFLRRLAICRALDRLRQRRVTCSLDDVELPDDAGGPEEQAIGNELAARLREAIAQLAEREAAVFCLRYFDELSNTKIAESLGISAAAVGVALYRARARLETLLTEAVKETRP